jgi:hypothetical protein
LKKKTLTVAFVSILLFSTAFAVTQLVNLAQANLFIRVREKEGDIPPPYGILLPKILISSLENNTAYASNNVSLILNVTMSESNKVTLHIIELYYSANWLHEVGQPIKYDVEATASLTDMSEGPR